MGSRLVQGCVCFFFSFFSDIVKSQPFSKSRLNFKHLFFAEKFCLDFLTNNLKLFFFFLQENGDAPLHIATKSKNIEICKMLVNGGANTDAKNVSMLIVM